MKKEKRASIRLSNEMWGELQELSKVAETTVSETVRVILADYLKFYKSNKYEKAK